MQKVQNLGNEKKNVYKAAPPPPPVPVGSIELRVYPRQLVNVSAPFLCRLSRLYQDEWPLACFLYIWYVPALHSFTRYVYLFALLYSRTPLQ